LEEVKRINKKKMVRNNTGGGNAKKQGRKYQGVDKGEVERAGEGEEYGYVCEMKGGCECIVKIYGREVRMRCKIGGKFRGRNKRSNYIEKGTLLIVGERSWEEGRGDVLYVYDKEEKDRMREEYGIKEEEEEGENEGESVIEFRKGHEKEINEEAVKKEVLERVKEISIEDL
jgi:hypothetical protein